MPKVTEIAKGELVPVSVGDKVFAKSFGVDGSVVCQENRPRSYVIDTPSGLLWRKQRDQV